MEERDCKNRIIRRNKNGSFDDTFLKVCVKDLLIEMIEDSKGDTKKEKFIEEFIEKNIRFLTEDETCPVTERNLTSIIEGMGVYLFKKPNSFPNETSPDYIRKDFNKKQLSSSGHWSHKQNSEKSQRAIQISENPINGTRADSVCLNL